MNNFLALDCTDRACSVATRKGETVREIFVSEQRLHARRLLGLIEDSLSEGGMDKSDLEALVWSHGPGSFTGLRIAGACVQGLSYALNIPVIGLSSLMALALRAAVSVESQKIWVGLDARMGEVYTATYLMGGGELIALEPDRLVSADKVSLPGDCQHYLGSALDILDTEGLNGCLDSGAQVHAGDLLRLGPEFLQRQPRSSALQVEPKYLRNADAWKKLEAQ